MMVTDVPAHSHIECDFLNKHILVGNGPTANSNVSVFVANDISNYIPEAQNLPNCWQQRDKCTVYIILIYSVSCISPACPCSAAVPLRSHTCGGGSSCRLCSGGRASPCSPPGTPHAWLLYLIHTHTHTQKRGSRFRSIKSGTVLVVFPSEQTKRQR